MSKVVEKLDDMNRTLERHNDIAQKMLDVMEKPESKFIRGLKMVVLFVSVLGIFSVADVIRKWIIGGWYVGSVNNFESYRYT